VLIRLLLIYVAQVWGWTTKQS